MSKRKQPQAPLPRADEGMAGTREDAFLRLKIHPRHRERLAVVYVRQSTLHQVRHHRESRERQYALAEHAKRLGWPQDRILIIDEDQGQSGRSAEDRKGFQRLLVEVNLDHVGLILGLEMNRLARSSKDWQHLFEVCAIFSTLLSDEEGVYDPNDSNDRLLLGLKGILSEIELHTMRVRLHRGCLNKAERGELHMTAPIGYVITPAGELQLDPDEQARTAVRLIFEKFEELGSAAAVFRYLKLNQIRAGVRRAGGENAGELEWRVLNPATVTSMLHHPNYAGAYVYGRRQNDARRRAEGHYNTHPSLDMSQWKVLLKDRVPAYITWDQYLANQRRLRDNRSCDGSRGAPRTGSCLLGGLIHCGHCGDRLKVTYRSESHRRNVGQYGCRRYDWDPHVTCPSTTRVQAEAIDRLVGEQLVQALAPASLELSLRTIETVQQERDQLEQVWRQRLERAHYEVERAFRQYNAVEPENRLVTRTLEQRWEKALATERQLEREYDRFLQEHPQRLTVQERARIEALSKDLPALWESSSLSMPERKEIVRLVIERVEVSIRDNKAIVPVTIHWVGGHQSRHEVKRRVGSYRQVNDYARLTKRLIELRDEAMTAAEIAAVLNQEGFQPARGQQQMTGPIVHNLLIRLRANPLPGRKLDRRFLRKDEWTLAQLAKKVKVKHGTLLRWCRVGWVQTRKLPGAANRWLVWADAEELDRLRRLRERLQTHQSGSYPKELTTPKPRP